MQVSEILCSLILLQAVLTSFSMRSLQSTTLMRTYTRDGNITIIGAPDKSYAIQAFSLLLKRHSLSGSLILESVLKFHQDTIHWGLNFTNLTGQPVEIGDVALPLRMNTSFSGITSSVLKHHFISGYGSFIFWMP